MTRVTFDCASCGHDADKHVSPSPHPCRSMKFDEARCDCDGFVWQKDADAYVERQTRTEALFGVPDQERRDRRKAAELSAMVEAVDLEREAIRDDFLKSWDFSWSEARGLAEYILHRTPEPNTHFQTGCNQCPRHVEIDQVTARIIRLKCASCQSVWDYAMAPAEDTMYHAINCASQSKMVVGANCDCDQGKKESEVKNSPVADRR